MKTSELLRKAADEIRQRGWHQGDYGSNIDDPKVCKVCSYGAVRAASTGDPWLSGPVVVDDAHGMLYRVIREPGRPTSVVDWNDAPGRTVEEVLDVFEKAAQAAEAEEN